jgi:hypothetical protein
MGLRLAIIVFMSCHLRTWHRAQKRSVKNYTVGHINFWTHYNYCNTTQYTDLSTIAQHKRDKNHFAFLCSLNWRAFGCEDYSCNLLCLACDDRLDSHDSGYVRECTHCLRKTNIKCLVDKLSPDLSTDVLDTPALSEDDAKHFLQYYTTQASSVVLSTHKTISSNCLNFSVF